MSLQITSWGHGPTRAVFLHGFAGSSQTFAHLEPLLGERFSAVCVDLPGHRGTPSLSWGETVDAVGELLTPRTVLIGYSQGARIALATAIRFPHRVERLVLESASPGLRQRKARTERRRADAALAELIVAQGVEAFVQHWEQQPLFSGLRLLPAVEQEALKARRLGHDAEGLAGALKMLGQGAQPNLWPALPRLLVPTLLLCGADDGKYTKLARSMTKDLPLAWAAIFPNVGHAPHLECPRLYAREIESFLTPQWTIEPREHAP